MAVVIHKRGRMLDDSDCDDDHHVKTKLVVGRFNSRWLYRFISVAARETIQLVMIIMLLKIKPSWDYSIREGCRDL